MEQILDRDGNVIQQSRNLRGIRKYVSNNLIQALAIDEIANGEGKLQILFEDGSNFETNFASWEVLKNFVRNWRNVYGAPFVVNCKKVGNVYYNHELLK
jgi:hypothetical protein